MTGATPAGHPVSDRVRRSFPAEAPSVAAARQYTTSRLVEWGLAGQSVAASLIVSELASNALRHAGSTFEVELSRVDEVVRIAVSDGSVTAPVLQHTTPDSESGFGLWIVAKLASDWGFELGGDGKEVWARLTDGRMAKTSAPAVAVEGRARRAHAEDP